MELLLTPTMMNSTRDATQKLEENCSVKSSTGPTIHKYLNVSIFWLNGMAGTGKSATSRTVAQSFADKQPAWGPLLLQERRERPWQCLLFVSHHHPSTCGARIPALVPYVRKAS
jgi:hypothetical protein